MEREIIERIGETIRSQNETISLILDLAAKQTARMDMAMDMIATLSKHIALLSGESVPDPKKH